VSVPPPELKQWGLMPTDGAAGIATQLIGLAGRAGGEVAEQFTREFRERMESLP
jgi:hypothetical protein